MELHNFIMIVCVINRHARFILLKLFIFYGIELL